MTPPSAENTDVVNEKAEPSEDSSSSRPEAGDGRPDHPNTAPGDDDPTRWTTADKEAHGDSDEIEMTEQDCYDELGFSFPEWKKWTILSVIFLVQVSMNFNTSL
ncbi:hypothetical protein LTR28_010825, partial [Elasticomyces elasticus]